MLKSYTISKTILFRVLFDNCDDNSYDIFTYWLSETRELFDSIIMINTNNDEATKEKHVFFD